MARSRETKIELTAYDDLFETDQSREEAALSKIRDIPIAEIDEFPDHPFKVLMDEDMEQLVDSIKRSGVMTPATVRMKEDGRYELISGHRRKKACELAGLDRIIFRVSSYGALSRRMEDILSILRSNRIRHEVIDYKTWYKNSEIEQLCETEAELRKKFNSCMEGCGMVSWKGRLYFCTTLPFLLEEGVFPPSEDNFYDMRNDGLEYRQSLKAIYRYVDRCNTDHYVDACRFCTGKSTTNFKQAVPVAEQVDGLPKMSPICVESK